MKRLRRNGGLLLAVLFLVCSCLLVYYQNSRLDEAPFQVHFIDVGQGDAALVICDGHAMLIDCGDLAGGYFAAAYLTDHGVKELDHLVISHNHLDHIGGMERVLNCFPVGKIWMSPDPENNSAYSRVTLRLENEGLEVEYPKAGRRFALGDAVCQFLGDASDFTDNDSSLVLRIEYGQDSLLFVGDAEVDRENRLLAYREIDHAELLKVGHHGGRASSSQDFINAVDPDIAVISVGVDNDYGHPSKEVLDRLSDADIYRTDREGSIVFFSGGNGLVYQN